MNNSNQTKLFRLAAVLYADSNYEVSPKLTLKRIIESALLSNNNKPMSIQSLVDYIRKTYSLYLDETEINKIIEDERESAFIINNSKYETILYLNEKRKLSLENKISNKTIDYFITEFENNMKYPLEMNIKELINKFLYQLFTSNIESFKKLISKRVNIEDLEVNQLSDYSIEECKIINSFLSWGNNEKNKAIFDIASCALEYFMISNNGTGVKLKLDNIKNKSFYLDTNIIFWAMGINGESRKNRTISFLRKFIDSANELLISKFTDSEFKETVKYYAGNISKYPNGISVKDFNFENLNIFPQKDLYSFYCDWCIGRVNTSIEYFISYVDSLYDEFIVKYNITVELKIPFDPKIINTKEKIDNLASDISNYKKSFTTKLYFNSLLTDASNIHLIETKRGSQNINIFDTKYYLISADTLFRRWDYQRIDATPIVLLPEEWLSIILRFINRTDDDYASFVSFINLSNRETQIPFEKIYIVFAGIYEMAQDIDTRISIAQNIVENNFKGVIENGQNIQQIFENAKTCAKTELEKRIDELENKSEQSSKEIYALKTAKDYEINEIKKDTKKELDKKITKSVDYLKKIVLKIIN